MLWHPATMSQVRPYPLEEGPRRSCTARHLPVEQATLEVESPDLLTPSDTVVLVISSPTYLHLSIGRCSITEQHPRPRDIFNYNLETQRQNYPATQ